LSHQSSSKEASTAGDLRENRRSIALHQTLEKMELTPQEAFLLAMDEAIGRTAQCLQGLGLDPETTWKAFRSALDQLVVTVTDDEAIGTVSQPQGCVD
jgi:hypothetical protein